MEYPLQLVPQPDFTIINFETVPPGGFTLIRHTSTADVWDDYNRLKADQVAFRTDHLHDYSTNLLGVFTVADIGWQWPKDSLFGALWQPGYPTPLPVYPTDVDWVNGRGYFFLAIPSCLRASFVVESSGGSENVVCFVVHTPTLGNFWHCSLRWVCRGEDVTAWPEKKRKHILKEARAFVVQRAQADHPVYAPVPAVYYTSSE